MKPYTYKNKAQQRLAYVRTLKRSLASSRKAIAGKHARALELANKLDEESARLSLRMSHAARITNNHDF